MAQCAAHHCSDLRLFAAVILGVVLMLAQSPRATARASDGAACELPCRISLDGQWRFMEADLARADLFARDVADATWRSIAVPANWYSQGYDYAGAAWYRRHFTLPAAKSGRIVRLAFDGVDYAADVWLNGVHVGFHEGYFQHFSFDVSRLVRADGDNLLAVRVFSPVEEPGRVWSLHKRAIKGIFSHHDTRPGGAWSARGQEHNTGGIWGSVGLLLSGPVAVDTLQISPRLDIARQQATAEVTARLHGATSARRFQFEITLEPENFHGQTMRFTSVRTIADGDSVEKFSVSVPQVQLWWPVGQGKPNLYRLVFIVSERGHVVERDEQIFGFRSIERQEGTGFWKVNGRIMYLRGTNYIPTQWLATMAYDSYLSDVRLMQAANINAIRVHAHVGDQAFYRVCDELGMLVWQDFPLQWGYEDTPELHAAATQQATEMVRQFYNHPSIFTWSLHNEPPWDADWMKYKYPDYDASQNRALDEALLRTVQAEDDTRYAHSHSSTAEHQWLGWYSGRWTDFAKPTTQSLITEYGAQALLSKESLSRIFTADELWPTTTAAWDKWEYHNFQRHETFDNAGVAKGNTLDEFIVNSQRYQSRLIQLAAESYRRQKYQPVGAIFQFMFVEDWPSINWGIVDFWRNPKPGYAALAMAYQPVLPSIEWFDETPLAGRPLRFRLWLINDRPDALAALRYSFVVEDRKGRGFMVKNMVVDAAADSASVVIDFRDTAPPPGQYTAVAWVTDATGAQVARNRLEFDVVSSGTPRTP